MCCYYSSWGESFFIAVQVVVLLALMFYYNNHAVYILVFLPVYGGTLWYLNSDLVTMEILATLQASVIPMMLLSRVSCTHTSIYKRIVIKCHIKK